MLTPSNTHKSATARPAGGPGRPARGNGGVCGVGPLAPSNIALGRSSGSAASKSYPSLLSLIRVSYPSLISESRIRVSYPSLPDAAGCSRGLGLGAPPCRSCRPPPGCPPPPPAGRGGSALLYAHGVRVGWSENWGATLTTTQRLAGLARLVEGALAGAASPPAASGDHPQRQAASLSLRLPPAASGRLR